MGASICWKKTDAISPTLRRVSAPSSFIDSMDRAFNGHPWILSDDDAPKLSGMAALFGGADKDNPYLELIELIEQVGSIEVWPQW